MEVPKIRPAGAAALTKLKGDAAHLEITRLINLARSTTDQASRLSPAELLRQLSEPGNAEKLRVLFKDFNENVVPHIEIPENADRDAVIAQQFRGSFFRGILEGDDATAFEALLKKPQGNLDVAALADSVAARLDGDPATPANPPAAVAPDRQLAPAGPPESGPPAPQQTPPAGKEREPPEAVRVAFPTLTAAQITGGFDNLPAVIQEQILSEFRYLDGNPNAVTYLGEFQAKIFRTLSDAGIEAQDANAYVRKFAEQLDAKRNPSAPASGKPVSRHSTEPTVDEKGSKNPGDGGGPPWDEELAEKTIAFFRRSESDLDRDLYGPGDAPQSFDDDLAQYLKLLYDKEKISDTVGKLKTAEDVRHAIESQHVIHPDDWELLKEKLKSDYETKFNTLHDAAAKKDAIITEIGRLSADTTELKNFKTVEAYREHLDQLGKYLKDNGLIPESVDGRAALTDINAIEQAFKKGDPISEAEWKAFRDHHEGQYDTHFAKAAADDRAKLQDAMELEDLMRSVGRYETFETPEAFEKRLGDLRAHLIKTDKLKRHIEGHKDSADVNEITARINGGKAPITFAEWKTFRDHHEGKFNEYKLKPTLSNFEYAKYIEGYLDGIRQTIGSPAENGAQGNLNTKLTDFYKFLKDNGKISESKGPSRSIEQVGDEFNNGGAISEGELITYLDKLVTDTAESVTKAAHQKISTQIRDTMGKVILAGKYDAPLNAETWDNLRALLRGNEKNLLIPDSSAVFGQTPRGSRHARSEPRFSGTTDDPNGVTYLGRDELISPLEIAKELQSGRPVSEAELNRLQGHFKIAEQSKRAENLAPHSSMHNPLSFLGAAATSSQALMKMNGALMVFDRAAAFLKNLDVNKTGPVGGYRKYHWETGKDLGGAGQFFKNSGWWAKPLIVTALAGSLGFFGYNRHLGQQDTDLNIVDRSGEWHLFNASVREALQNIIINRDDGVLGSDAHKFSDTVVKMVQKHWQSGGIAPNGEFDRGVKLVTDIDLFTPEERIKAKNGESIVRTFDLGEYDDLQYLYKIIQSIKQKGTEGNSPASKATRLAVINMISRMLYGSENAASLGDHNAGSTNTNPQAWQPTDNPLDLERAWINTLTSRMANNKGFAEKVIKDYYGRAIDFSDPESLRFIANDFSVSKGNNAQRSAILAYLEMSGAVVLPSDEILNDRTKLEEEIQKRVKANLSSRVTSGFTVLGAGKYSAPPSSETDCRYRFDRDQKQRALTALARHFNKEQLAAVSGANNSSLDSNSFADSLRRQGISEDKIKIAAQTFYINPCVH